MKTLKSILIIAVLTAMSVSCTKEVLLTSGKDLGHRIVDAKAGQFPVYVATIGVWSAKSLNDWISVSPELHKDATTFIVNYASNESREGDSHFNRIGRVVICTYDGATADTLQVWQRGITPHVEISGNGIVPVEGGRCKVPLRTNLSDSERKGITVSSAASWVKSVAYSVDGRSLDLDLAAGSAREAVITFTHTPVWGESTSFELKIKQEDE